MIHWVLLGGGAVLLGKLAKDWLDEDPPKGSKRPGAQGQKRKKKRGALPKGGQAAAPAPPDFGAFVWKWFMPTDGRAERTGMEASADLLSETSEDKPPLVTPSRVTIVTGLVALGLTIWIGWGAPEWVEWGQEISLGALVGVGTNWIAVKMLFRPAERNFIGLHGVIPANREAVVDALANGVSRELLDPETIRNAIHDSGMVSEGVEEAIERVRATVSNPEFKGDVEELIRGYVLAFVQNKKFRSSVIKMLCSIARVLPEKAQFVPEMLEKQLGNYLAKLIKAQEKAIIWNVEQFAGPSVENMSDKIVAWLEDLPDDIDQRREEIEQSLTKVIARAASKIDIAEIVREKLEGFDAGRLERMILDATEKHLQKIQYFGWGLGAVAAPLVMGLEELVGWVIT